VSAQNDGGPAFPVTNPAIHDAHGMTMRDWFAGQALAQCIARSSARAQEELADDGQFPTTAGDIEFNDPAELCCEAGRIARSAYEVADTMIAARAMGGTQ